MKILRIVIIILFFILDVLIYVGEEDPNETLVIWLVLFILFFKMKGLS